MMNMSRLRLWSLAALAATLSCTKSVEVEQPTIERTLEVVAGATPLTQAVFTVAATVPSVRITDGAGAPVAGERVLFFVTRGGGTLGAGDVTTDANGIASPVSWRYGTRAGPQAMSAALVSATADARASFTGTAVPGPTVTTTVTPAAVALRPGTTRQLVASTVDAYGNPTVGGPTPSFLSLDAAVATVSGTGLVTAVSAGTTTVRATIGAAIINVPVTVGDRPTGSDVTSTNVGDGPFSAAVRADGLVYIARGVSNALARIQLPSTALQGYVNSASNRTSDVTFVPGIQRAYSANVDLGTVSVVNTSTHALDHTIPIGSEMLRIRANAAGDSVYATTINGGVKRIATATDGVISVAAPGFLNGLVLNEPRGVLYATSTGGMLYEISLSNFTLSRSIPLGGTLQGVAVSPDGGTVFVAMEGTGTMRLDATTLAAGPIFGPASAFDVAVSRDGVDVYVAATAQSTVSVHVAATGAPVRTHAIANPRRITFTIDGLTAIVMSETGSAFFIK